MLTTLFAALLCIGTPDADAPPALTLSSPPAGDWSLSLGTGAYVSHDTYRPPYAHITVKANATWAITERLQWSLPFPAFAYRFGDVMGTEVIVSAGFTQFGSGDFNGIDGHWGVPVALDVRHWLSSRGSLNIRLAGGYSLLSHPGVSLRAPFAAADWAVLAGLGYSYTAWDLLTLNISANFSENLGGNFARYRRVGIGSVLGRSLRPLPLLQWHVAPRWSVDAYASALYEMHDQHLIASYAMGFSHLF